MIVHDLDAVGVSVAPFEADAPLIVDPDAVLSFAVSQEVLAPISR
jgi:hypothetical protein